MDYSMEELMRRGLQMRGRPAVSGACAVRIMKKLYDIDMEEMEGPRGEL